MAIKPQLAIRRQMIFSLVQFRMLTSSPSEPSVYTDGVLDLDPCWIGIPRLDDEVEVPRGERLCKLARLGSFRSSKSCCMNVMI